MTNNAPLEDSKKDGIYTPVLSTDYYQVAVAGNFKITSEDAAALYDLTTISADMAEEEYKANLESARTILRNMAKKVLFSNTKATDRKEMFSKFNF